MRLNGRHFDQIDKPDISNFWIDLIPDWNKFSSSIARQKNQWFMFFFLDLPPID